MIKNIYTNTKYKDALFRFIFNNPYDLLSLYNAVNNTNYSTDKAPAGVGADFSHDKLTASVSPVIGESVTTGDTSNIAFLLALFLMSGAAIAAVCIYDRKRRIVK